MVQQPIKLYEFIPSPNCERVKVVLEEKSLPYQSIPINIRRGEQRTPEYLRLNPSGKVPVIVDGEVVLYESCIINEYLNERYPDTPLMPQDPAQRAKIRILIDYGIAHMGPTFTKLRLELAKTEFEKDAQVVALATSDLRKMCETFEQQLADRQFLAGDLCLLDAALVPRFIRMEAMGVLPAANLPRLFGWLLRMKERPSVKAIM